MTDNAVVVPVVEVVSKKVSVTRKCNNPCVDPEIFVMGGQTLTTLFFLFFDEIQKSTIGLPAKRHQHGFRWWADSGQTLNAGLVIL